MASLLPPKVQKTSFTFKSDLRKSQFDSRPCCGVIHAFRSSNANSSNAGVGRDEHSFAWVANYDVIEAALQHLEKFGFTRDALQFIPYSSKSNWINKYPHAFPYVDCDAAGNVTGFPYWSPHAQSSLDIPPEVVAMAVQPSTREAVARSSSLAAKMPAAAVAAASSAKKKGGGAKLGDTLLTNNERTQLHNEIFNYFSWLANQVEELETTDSGRRAVKKADLTINSLRGLLFKMESTFKSVRQLKEAKGEEAADLSAFPLLEGSLVNEMSNLAAVHEEEQKKLKAKIKAEKMADPSKKSPHYEPLDFETMFNKLLMYKEAHGHPNVPVKYSKDVQLGSWVSGLRTKKKAYDKDGDNAMDLEAEEAAWSMENEDDGTGTPAKERPLSQQKYLNPDRIQRLESIGFAWSMSRPKQKQKSWDERLDDLKTWHDENASWKVPRNTSLGEWLHNQRTLYGKRDVKFMAKRFPRMEAIGYTFDLREGVTVSWDDRFQQLVEYKNTHGNFDVPCPVSEEMVTDGAVGNSEETEEKFRFYKWVRRLHNEYRAFEKGTHSKLNQDRVDRLKGINFEFKGPQSRGRPSTSSGANPVPGIPWEKRIQQLEAFKADVGHLGIDHNYRHCSNLGGWAADMSTLYRNWQSGSQQLSEDMIAKFNQLSAMGFEFNVLSYYENNRSWLDHYNLLLKFKEATGSARVPIKYKADLRLGKWVQSQRQQYKLLQEGKPSKLTEERINMLENVGFEWTTMSGDKDEEDGMEEQNEEV